jgi:CheY-like chemotaxis protein
LGYIYFYPTLWIEILPLTMNDTLGASPKKIMLIDDNPIDHFLLKNVLEHGNFAMAIYCTSAEEGLQFLNAQEISMIPDVIFIDINMPSMNGFDFLEAFQDLNNQIKQKCFIVMFSSSVDMTDVQRATNNSYVKMYLAKPITQENLIAVLKNLEKNADSI